MMTQRIADEERERQSERQVAEQLAARPAPRPEARRDLGWWAMHGAFGGLIAGLIFAAFEMIMAAALMGAEAFFMPLRMIGGLLLGPQALDPAFPLLTAGVIGVVVHVVVSVLYGIVFGAAAGLIPALARSAGVLALAASAFGFVLWIVNFFVFAPMFGWTWFPQETNAVVQFVAHTFFYGTALGLYLTWALRRG
jgi:hypothetical protein